MNIDGANIDSSPIGANTASTGAFTSLSATVADNSAALTLISTDTDANQGPVLDLKRNPGEAGADNDYIGQIYWTGYNDAGTPEAIVYSKLTSQIVDASDGTEDANMVAFVMKGGSRKDVMRLGPTETVFNEGSEDIDFRVESDGNANMLFVDGGNNRVGFGTGTPSTDVHIYSTSDNAPHLLLENFQNADTDDAAVIELYLNDQTTGGIGDDTDVGVIRFTGDEKDGGSKETYAEIRGVAHDPGQGASNKGNLSFFVQAAGDLNETLKLDEDKVVIGGDITKGSGEFKIKNTANGENVGIYTTSSSSELHALKIHSGGNVEVLNGNLVVGNASGATITMNDTDGSEEDFAFVLGANALAMRKTSNSNDIIRLDLTNERVGIGTTSPEGALDVNIGTAGVWTGVFDNTASGGAGVLIKSAGATGSENLLDVRNGDGTKFVVKQSDGKVGIGTSSPAEILTLVASSGDCNLRMEGSAVRIKKSGVDWLSYDGANLKMSTGNSERARFNSSGRLLVSSTSELSPNARVFINANSNSTNPALNLKAATTTSSGSIVIFFAGDSDEVGSIGMSNLEQGTGVSYNTGSDARWKDVTGEARGLEVINNLNPVAFNWKKSGLSDEGLIAQEVQEHVPNIVKEGSNGYLQMDYGKLVTPLIKAVQELSAEVEQLKQQAHEKCEN